MYDVMVFQKKKKIFSIIPSILYFCGKSGTTEFHRTKQLIFHSFYTLPWHSTYIHKSN